MSYLDLEIQRIEKYIAGLGIKLNKKMHQTTFSDTKDYGTWAPHEIDLYVNEHKTKSEILLTLLHEIGHQIHYMHNGRPEIPDEVLLPLHKLTKTERKRILDYEKPGIELMPVIATELALKIPMWKVYLQSEFDLWMYEVLYETGSYPTNKNRKIKKKELLSKYKGKKYE